MVDLQNMKYGFRYFGVIAILLLHNLDTCTSIGPYHDKALEQGDVRSSRETTTEQTKHVAVAAPHSTAATVSSDVSDSSPPNDDRRESQMPPIHFPTNSPNSSSSVRILTIDDCANISAHLISMLNKSSMAPVYFPTPTASASASANMSHLVSLLLSGRNATVPGAEADDMTHGKKYDGQYDVDDVKGIAKKYNHTKETKNVTKPPSVVDSKKDLKIDSNKNGTKSPTPEDNNKTATAEDVSKAEAKPLPESKNKTNVVGKTEEVHRGEATLIVPASPQREILGQQKGTSTLREVGKTLAAILVTIVGTASMLFVGFLMWRRISRRYYGHREMLINEDDFEEVSDLHHFEGTTDTPSQTIISQR